MNDVLAANLRRRVRGRAKRHWPELATLFVICVLGLTLSNSFFVASTSVLNSLDDFATRTHQEAGYFQVTGTDENGVPTGSGIEAIRSADVKGPGASILRVFEPRVAINIYEVVAGRDTAGDNDILLDEKFAKAHHLGVGKTIRVSSSDFTIVGFATAPDYITTKKSEIVLQPNADRFGIAFVTKQTFDSMFAGVATTQYAFDDSRNVRDIAKQYQPAVIRGSDNNSRIQQVIGDSAAPRDLAALIFVIFLIIIGTLIAVYHFEVRRNEANNLAAFDQLGLSERLHLHYRTETTITLCSAWLVSTVTTIAIVPSVMSINGKLYNYPKLHVDYVTLTVVSIAVLAVLLLTEWFCYRAIYSAKGQVAITKRKATRIQLHRLKLIPEFGWRLRIVRGVRNTREIFAILGLVLVVGMFINFSLLLKVSVDEYVGRLARDTPYNYMYILPGATAGSVTLGENDEFAQMATLYDKDGIAQMVFSVPRTSRYFGPLPGTAVTSAFANKYDIGVGDEVELHTIDFGSTVSLHIDKIIDNATSAMVYVPNDTYLKDLEAVPSAGAIFTDIRRPELDDTVPTVTRIEIASSGERIVEIINIQITMLLAIAVILLGIMLSSIYRFTFGTQSEFIRIMRMNGYSARTLLRSLFGFSGLAILIAVGTSYLMAIGVVRAFLDKIMGRFVNFVPVTSSWLLPVLAISVIAALFGVLLTKSYLRLRRS